MLHRELPAQVQEQPAQKVLRQEHNVRVQPAPIHAHQAVITLQATRNQEQQQVLNITVAETLIKALPPALITQEAEGHRIPIQDLQKIQDQIVIILRTAGLPLVVQVIQDLPAAVLARATASLQEAVLAQATAALQEAVQAQAIAVLPEAVLALVTAVLPEAAPVLVTAVLRAEAAVHREAVTAVAQAHRAAGRVHPRQVAAAPALQDLPLLHPVQEGSECQVD